MYNNFTHTANADKQMIKPAMSSLSIDFNRFHIIVVVYRLPGIRPARCYFYLFIAIINDPQLFETSIPVIVSDSYELK